MRILIVGAGPTGLTAALELARRGVEIEVIERREGPSKLSRAVGLLASSIEILHPSGVADAIEAEAIAFSAVMFHRGRRLVARIPLNFDDRSRFLGLAQDRTEGHLADALGRYGVAIRYGTPFEGLSQDERGVEVRRGGETARSDHVLGADGVRSSVRQALGIPYEGFDLPGE